MTLFTTHYFELTQLPKKIKNIANIHLDTLKHNDTITFIHNIQNNTTNKNYNLTITTLTNIPKKIIKHTRQKLHKLKNISPNTTTTQINNTQISLLSIPKKTSPTIETLKNLNPNSLTPHQTLK